MNPTARLPWIRSVRSSYSYAEIRTTRVDGIEVPTRGHLGVFTQPLSFIGLSVISVPVVAPGTLPVGVQLVAAPFNEAALFRVAARLEAEGVVRAPVV